MRSPKSLVVEVKYCFIDYTKLNAFEMKIIVIIYTLCYVSHFAIQNARMKNCRCTLCREIKILYYNGGDGRKKKGLVDI